VDRSSHFDDAGETDESLVARAREGDRSALDLLLRRNEVRVLRVLRLMGVPEADREDVAQDVFLRVFQHLSGFRAGQAFGGWIYRIAVNASHDYRGRIARRNRDESQWVDGLEDAPSTAPDPTQEAESKGEWRRLEVALQSLSPRERAVFILCEMEELNTRQVAKALQITSITVRRHLGRARKHLQRVLKDQKK
jgi:RNA polymerase sigma-70 factor (ECF subfamily)